jgi:hypothetical protein
MIEARSIQPPRSEGYDDFGLQDHETRQLSLADASSKFFAAAMQASFEVYSTAVIVAPFGVTSAMISTQIDIPKLRPKLSSTI